MYVTVFTEVLNIDWFFDKYHVLYLLRVRFSPLLSFTFTGW